MSERETNVVTPTHVPTEPWTATALRSLVHGIVAVVATIPIAVPAGVLSAALGAAVGAVVGRAVSGSRLRVLGAAIGTLGACAVVVAVRSLLADGPSLAASVGPESAASIADAWSFGAGAFVFSALLRFASARRRTLAILEVVAIGLAFAQLVRARTKRASLLFFHPSAYTDLRRGEFRYYFEGRYRERYSLAYIA
ncbi:MAG: hypothetical protein KC417_10640, partial [Myxococcales bacterium]|nr:hypothetical protein [Myxococcales bacterium]